MKLLRLYCVVIILLLLQIPPIYFSSCEAEEIDNNNDDTQDIFVQKLEIVVPKRGSYFAAGSHHNIAWNYVGTSNSK